MSAGGESGLLLVARRGVPQHNLRWAVAGFVPGAGFTRHRVESIGFKPGKRELVIKRIRSASPLA